MPLEAKRAMIEQMLGRGSVMIYADSRREVAAPDHLLGAACLALRFGFRLTPEIYDLTIDESAIAGTLRFGAQSFRCVLPWNAIWGAKVDGDEGTVIWPDEAPAEILEQVARAQTAANAKPARAGLKLVN